MAGSSEYQRNDNVLVDTHDVIQGFLYNLVEICIQYRKTP